MAFSALRIFASVRDNRSVNALINKYLYLEIIVYPHLPGTTIINPSRFSPPQIK